MGTDATPLVITAVTVNTAQNVPEVRRLPEVVRGPGRLALVLLVAAVEDSRGPGGVQPRARPA